MAFLYVDRGSTSSSFFGIAITVLLHGALLGGVWWSKVHASEEKPAGPGVFVDAQLVRFGKPRDMSFLPKKTGSVKQPPTGLKIARDADQAPNTNKEEKPDVDPLKKTRSELFKKMQEENEGSEATNEGSLTGSKAGTATEAKGDPYIIGLVDKIGSAWSVPTTIRDDELKELTSEVCLTIAPNGELTSFKVIRKSGNSQFDSSLEAALGQIRNLDPPPARFLGAATRGKLCPTFAKL